MSLPVHSSKTSPLYADASFAANVQKVLEFLDKDTTYATDVMKKELDLIQAHVDTVNSFIVVATFIAAVQGQIVALTFGVNDTSLQIFTNGIGLIGLTFDILGTSFGMLLALALQGYIRRSKAWLNGSTMEGLANSVNWRIGKVDEDREKIEEDLDEYIRERRIFWRQRWRSKILPGDKGFIAHRDQFLGQTTHIKRLGTSTILSLSPGPQRIIVMANIPMVTMGFGVISLFVSVICFAASTQHPHVWMACVIVAMTTIACSLGCLAYLKLPEVLVAYALKSSTNNQSHVQENKTPHKFEDLAQRLNSSQSF